MLVSKAVQEIWCFVICPEHTIIFMVHYNLEIQNGFTQQITQLYYH